MLQFNLLPDVKQQYVKAKRTQRLVTLASIAVSIAAVFVLLLLIVSVDVVQKKSLSDLNGKIASYSNRIKAVPDLDKILTVQNQLSTLTNLHDTKPVASRLFGYLSQVTPSQASISNLSVDYTANTMIITGDAPSLDVVNAFADTLKNTKYTTDAPGAAPTKAFSDVVLSSFSRTDKSASYTINLTFDPVIFNSANTVKLTVPSTNSGPQADLFQMEKN